MIRGNNSADLMQNDMDEKTRMERAHSRGVTTSGECLLVIVYTQEPRAESETPGPEKGYCGAS